MNPETTDLKALLGLVAAGQALSQAQAEIAFNIIMSGDATATSKSIQPPSILATISSPPASTAPAARASSTTSDVQNATTRWLFPVPLGSETEPRNA